MLRKSLLACGAVASALYIGIDLLAAIAYPGYHSFFSQAISELMARDAPTERLVDPLLLAYDVLMMAFAVGVLRSTKGTRARVASALLFVYAASGLLGPTVFEMNVRGSGGDPAHDVAHLVFTGVLSLCILAAVAAGATMFGRGFRRYSYVTLAVMLVFGGLTGLTSSGISPGEPTPWMGIMERILIGAFMLWVVVLSVGLLHEGRGLSLDSAHGATPA